MPFNLEPDGEVPERPQRHDTANSKHLKQTMEFVQENQEYSACPIANACYSIMLVPHIGEEAYWWQYSMHPQEKFGVKLRTALRRAGQQPRLLIYDHLGAQERKDMDFERRNPDSDYQGSPTLDRLSLIVCARRLISAIVENRKSWVSDV